MSDMRSIYEVLADESTDVDKLRAAIHETIQGHERHLAELRQLPGAAAPNGFDEYGRPIKP